MYIYKPNIVEQTTENIQETQSGAKRIFKPNPEARNHKQSFSERWTLSFSITSINRHTSSIKTGDQGWNLHPVQNCTTLNS